MQRYHATNCTSAVNNNSIGGGSARDGTGGRADSLAANFSVNSRRPPPLTAYKLKCDKEPLNSRLGAPDFYPQTVNCPEETLTREYLQVGYRETVEGLEEAREISLSEVQVFTKPVVIKCREAIRKCLRAINESRAQKRKAGQVYGVPLSGLLLTKPGVFPEQRPCSDDFKKKWIEGLSQPHKRLRSLADHVPHGYRRKSLFEVLIRNNVPLLRATWYIKVNYLNQMRPSSTNISSGTPDKTQLIRTDLWTKDFVEYLQILLDEFICKGTTHYPQSRDRSPQMPYGGSVPQRSELLVLDSEEPSLHFKWWYVVRLLHWHHTEGLLSPSVIIDWVLNQMQEKDALEVLQLLLPIIYGFLEDIVLSQTYVRTLASIAVRFIREPSPGGSDLVDNSRRAYTTSALIEMLRYLLLAVPDTFVAVDCFPLPLSVMSYAANDGTFASKASERPRQTKDNAVEVACTFRSKGLDAQYQSLSLNQVVSTIQKRANNLLRAACPGYPVRSVAKAVQALDKALMLGDISGAFDCLFENFCDGTIDQSWTEEISPWLRSSLKWVGAVSLPFVCSVFLLCEWATCDYRDFRTAPPDDLKFSGGKDFSQVHIVHRLLKLKLRDLQTTYRQKNDSSFAGNNISRGSGKHNISRATVVGGYEITGDSRAAAGANAQCSHLFESPGPLHDIIVCWIDQHEICKGGGLKRILLLVTELMRSGIFYPQAYVRQLISSGAMDMSGHATDLDRGKKHYQILKQLPGSFVHDILQGARVAEGSELLEVVRVYSNERRLLLNGLLSQKYKSSLKSNSLLKEKIRPVSAKDGATLDNLEQLKLMWSAPGITPKRAKMEADITELKTSISVLLRFPNSSTSSDSGVDESQGSSRKSVEALVNKIEALEGTPGCEDCRKAKRQKLSEEKSSYLGGNSPISDDEETWWVRKGPKLFDSPKLDPPLKSTKQVSKGRQKIVRKTQSLAQLGANRTDSSLGASTSHVCDNKVNCPHHRTGTEGEPLKPMDGIRTLHGDIASIGKALRKLRLAEKQAFSTWLIGVVHQLVEEAVKKAPKMSQFTRAYVPAVDRSSTCWKLGEDELSMILYLIDGCGDMVSAARLLLWLLPKVPANPNSTIHTGRNMMMMTKNVEIHACEVGETFLFSALRRYENTLVAADLIPEVLSAAMQRVITLLASNGRVSGAAVVYSRHLLRKYGNVPSVSAWEKSFKTTCDKRLVPELARSTDGELGYPLGVPVGVENVDDFVRQKMSVNRLSRLGNNMRETVQRNVDEAFQYFYGKERKVLNSGTPKIPGVEKHDDGYRVAQQIVVGLMDCIRQTGGAAQEGDPSLVSSAVSAIVHNVGPTMAKMPDFVVGSDYSSGASALGFARRLLRIHLNCLCLLREALGERQSPVFEIALANEASSALAVAFAPSKISRSQFQSSEAHDSNANISHETMGHSVKSIGGRSTKNVAAISALVIGAIVHGVSNIERMVTVFRLEEGLDVTQYLRSTKSNSNGNARLVGGAKVDTPLEVYVHWFRLLVGNCKTVCDGLVVELLGEQYVAALSRMQRLLPISLVFPPAYSIFAFVIWRPLIFNSGPTAREDIQQLCNSLTMAIADAIKHLPFRDACLRDSQVFYDLVAADNSDAELAALIDSNGLDRHFKYMAFVPLRGRLFLSAIVDCKMPCSVFTQDDGNRISGHGGSKHQQGENGAKLLDKLVDVLDALQPAKFHWQWVELRLLLNEQAVIERLENLDMPFADAIRSASSVSENENNIIEIILTRLLVRPDAASLFSELIHLLGRSLEDSMLMQAKWFLGGPDVLYGRKSIRQRLMIIAKSKGLPTRSRFWKPWGWANTGAEVSSLEEGEVVEENADTKRSIEGSNLTFELEGFSIGHQQATERALIQLVLPCIDRSSEDSRNTFANELIKQLNNIEQQISAVSRGVSKQPGMTSGPESPANKSNSRKGIRGGSPGLAKQRASVSAEPSIPSCTALRASMSLRLRLLLKLLPSICSDGEPSGRNMRHMLASVILRLLGSRIVHEDADRFPPMQAKRDMWFTSGDATADLSGESLFDRLLLVLHALLSGCQPSWLKPRPPLKSANESSKESFGCDRELVESLQNELDRMSLPGIIRWRIQSSMPILFPTSRCSISCQPPNISVFSLAPLLSMPSPAMFSGNQAQRNTVSSTRGATSIPGKPKLLSGQQDGDMEIDPWILLEDGTGSVPSSSNTTVIGSGDHSNLRASSWLKGAVRVRRTDLAYIGAVDEDS